MNNNMNTKVIVIAVNRDKPHEPSVLVKEELGYIFKNMHFGGTLGCHWNSVQEAKDELAMSHTNYEIHEYRVEISLLPDVPPSKSPNVEDLTSHIEKPMSLYLAGQFTAKKLRKLTEGLEALERA